MKQPLLSICIPTYNRAPFLREMLQSLVDAMPTEEDRIEILVSENAGTDNALQIAAEFQTKLANFTFWRNDHNIGAEGNFFKVLDRSQGRYVWLFGDDDIVRPNGLAEILPELERAEGYFILNCGIILADKNKRTQEAVFSQADNLFLRDKNQVMKKFDLRLGLITGMILKREVFQGVKREDFIRLAPTGFSFLYTAYFAAAHSEGRYLATPVFDYRAQNSPPPTAGRWAQSYGPDLRRVMIEIAQMGYSKSALLRFRTATVTKFFAFNILGDRIRGQPTLPYYRTLLTSYRDTPAAWLLLLTLFIPPWLAQLLRQTWRKWIGRLSGRGAV